MNRRIRKKLSKRKNYMHYKDFYRIEWENYIRAIKWEWQRKPAAGPDGFDYVAIVTTGGNYKRRLVLYTFIDTDTERAIRAFNHYRNTDRIIIFARRNMARWMERKHRDIKSKEVRA